MFVKLNDVTPFVAAVGAIAVPKSDQLASVANGAVVLELTLRCNCMVPTEPVANVNVLLPPKHTFGVFPDKTATLVTGLTFTSTTLEIAVVQTPLVTSALNQVLTVNAPVDTEVVAPVTTAHVAAVGLLES